MPTRLTLIRTGLILAASLLTTLITLASLVLWLACEMEGEALPH